MEAKNKTSQGETLERTKKPSQRETLEGTIKINSYPN